MSEFKQFFKNSKVRKVQVLCAKTFGGIATHPKVIAAFKSQKIMFFEGFDKAYFKRKKRKNSMISRVQRLLDVSQYDQKLWRTILQVFYF